MAKTLLVSLVLTASAFITTNSQLISACDFSDKGCVSCGETEILCRFALKTDDEPQELLFTHEDAEIIREWVRHLIWPWRELEQPDHLDRPFRTHGGIL